ncbi:hypothetical protein HY486_01205 [Candidatus Woesearchaeota archaeon]|nr:hypothetical protein [Candidatus Woesearchaeota archaeon]
MKRSQTEIFGLAFIVILITMAVFFGLFFFIGKKPPVQKGVESIMAANWLTTALNTNDPECQDTTLKELYTACIQAPNSIICLGSSAQPLNQNSCDRADALTEQMLDETFEKWNRQRYLTISEENTLRKKYGTPCPGIKESNTHNLYSGTTEIQVKLDLCR